MVLSGGEEGLSGQLLRDRAAALRRPMMTEVRERGRRSAADVESAVIVKVLILDGQNRVDEVRRYARQRRVHPLLLEDRERQLIVVVVDRRRLVHVPDPRDRLFIRQALLKIDEIPDGSDDRERGDDPEPDEQRPYEPRTAFRELEPLDPQLIICGLQLMHSALKRRPLAT